jgi:hypothetical protein
MLKYPLVRAAVLGFALLGIAWVGSLPWPSCEPPKPSAEAQQKDNAPQKYCASISGAIFTYIGHFIHDNQDEITAASTPIIAIFTAILGIFTIRLSRSTRVTADAAKGALIATARPKIIVRKV